MKISVITVTYNNDLELNKTLNSLTKCTYKPFEVIIIDGNSRDNTEKIVKDYMEHLNIKFISEKDDGIYDAMNKGKKLVHGELIHYLNAGDLVFGEPYKNIDFNQKLVVQTSLNNTIINKDYKGSIFGLSYCHQGVLFKKDHIDYNQNFKICADFDLMLKEFGKKLKTLKKNQNGGVIYDLSGVSSIKKTERDKEIIKILTSNKYHIESLLFLIIFFIKTILPNKLIQKIKQIKEKRF